jgi:superfamily I DNA and/or RNA helicase
VLVCIDEAARVSELKSLIPFGLYTLQVYILAGDYNQMQPTVLSAGRHLDNPAFVNPFQAQIVLSLFERLVLAGFNYTMLYMQH